MLLYLGRKPKVLSIQQKSTSSNESNRWVSSGVTPATSSRPVVTQVC